jgi:hypothetical protein
MPQTYYPYPQQATPQTRADLTALLTRRIVFVVVGLGGLLVWISLVALGFGVTDQGTLNLLRAIGITGSFLGFGGSLAGGLGSKQTNDNQNLGLLILSGAFVLALTLPVRF